MHFGIIGAMDEEIHFFQQTIKEYKLERYGALTFSVGEWHGHTIVFCKCGVGKVNAALTAQLLIDHYNIDALLFTGVAGAVDESLNVGDVIISNECQEHDIDASPLGFPRGTIPMYKGPSIFQADKELVEKAMMATKSIKDFQGNVVIGKVVSGDKFIANKNEVVELKKRFQASCVEMEGAAVAHVAHVNEIPYVVIRSISDKANGEAAESFDTFVKSAAKTSANIIENLLINI